MSVRDPSKHVGPCPWRITNLGQNHDAQGYCTLARRIGQPLMLSAWPDLSVRSAWKKSCSSSAFSTSSSTKKTGEK